MATNARPQPRRVRKRIWIPSALLIGLVLAFGWMGWRGTAADTEERNPKASAEGSITQLLARDGRTMVRAAAVVDAPAASVWRVVTDYNSHPRFMPYIARIASRTMDDGRIHIDGLAHSRLWGDWPIDIDITHREDAARGEYSAQWSEENRAGFAVSRGSWTLRELAPGQTLLAFAKEMEVPGYPNFLVRNILLDRVGSIVRGVRDEVGRRELK